MSVRVLKSTVWILGAVSLLGSVKDEEKQCGITLQVLTQTGAVPKAALGGAAWPRLLSSLFNVLRIQSHQPSYSCNTHFLFFSFFLTLRCRLHTVKSLIFTHMEWMCASHLLTLLSLTGADPAGEETGAETTGYCFPVLQDWTQYTDRTVQRIHAVSWSPALSDRSKVCGQHHARLSFNLGSGQFCQILHCFFFLSLWANP